MRLHPEPVRFVAKSAGNTAMQAAAWVRARKKDQLAAAVRIMKVCLTSECCLAIMARMTDEFAECISVLNDSPLRQGDIFVFTDEEADKDAWKKAGIIVTADCDLANNKHAGIVSYVPLLPLSDYLAQRLLPKLAEDLREKKLKALLANIRTLEASRGKTSHMSRRAVESWITKNDAAAEICAHLTPVSSDQASQIKDAIDAIKACLQAREMEAFDDQFFSLSNAYPPTKKLTSSQRLTEDISNRLKNLPGDSFFINVISPDHGGGYVAYLRIIRETRAEFIATDYYSQQAREIEARRVSRLQAPYVYRLTQLLAEVFSSIGLPEEYEWARSIVFESLVTKISDAGA